VVEIEEREDGDKSLCYRKFSTEDEHNEALKMVNGACS